MSAAHTKDIDDATKALIASNASLKIESIPGVCPEWASNIQTILFTEDQIKGKVNELAQQISAAYKDIQQPLLCVGLLTGAFVFVSDLLRRLSIPYEVDFMVVSSYGKGTQSSGSVKLKKDLSIDPFNRHVLVIEDLIDTGHTLAWIRDHLATKKAISVKTCCLLDKIARRTSHVDVEFVGFQCPDEFVIGYGMDFADQYRCLPMVGILKPSAYKK